MTIGLQRRTLAAGLAAASIIRPARAEAQQLRIARQYGVGYAQMALLEEQKLIEQHAKEAGLGAIEVTWSTFRSSDVMNDALLSRSLDIACLGIPGLATIWDRTVGGRSEIKGLSGLNVAPLALVSRDPAIHSLADYKPGMKIALPAVKVSNQAIFLQMAAAKLWGPSEYARLDPLTVSMSHPDALVALLSGGEITSYFGAPPFTQRALQTPGVHQVTDSAAILGEPASFNILGTSSRFYHENPSLAAAFVSALRAATDSINADKPAAAAIYARVTGDKTPLADLIDVMRNGVTYTLDVRGSLPVCQFMASTGVLKHRPTSWTEYMMPSAAANGGS